jgi:hypothetical protein
VTLSHSGGGQLVTRTITATDGGSATYSRSFDIDRQAPTVKLVGARNGGRYANAPRVRVVASDALSGLASKHVSRRHVDRNGVRTVILHVVARDLAGNVRRVTFHWHVTLG